MKNKKAEEVIKRLQEETETFRIKILGDEKNKENAFAILLNCREGFSSINKNEYFPINKKVIELFKEAEIKFKVL